MLTRVNNDKNGNPRYVCHFLDLLNDREKEMAEQYPSRLSTIDVMYKMAISKARMIGGRKFHNKKYGGGIAFQSFSITDLEKLIYELKLKTIV